MFTVISKGNHIYIGLEWSVIMDFLKMHGLGNDFVVLAQFTELPQNAEQLAIQICNRKFGVGADGLVFILPSNSADVRMRIMNADGTEAEQCGNAIRCVAKYVYDYQLVKNNFLTIQTEAGIQRVELHLDEKGERVSSVTVDMGEPILEGKLIPSALDQSLIIDQAITVGDKIFKYTAVSMGNPHAIIYVEDTSSFPVEEWGPQIEVDPLFPKKTNVEFVTVLSDGHVKMRVWERGVGETLACGTGACATAVASVLNEKTKRAVTVSLKGGDLYIEWNEEDNHVYMSGEATEVFHGTIMVE